MFLSSFLWTGVTFASFIVLRQHEAQDVLRLLNTNKASGPDAIHANLLKVAYDIISRYQKLRLIVNNIIRTI
jgi:rRNA pseudouridine-1189 N-methylase Emg1 (Nep1/Mra1 family)